MAEALEAPFDRPDAGFNDLPGWTWVGTYGGHYLQADLLVEFEHGFFTRQWQGRGPGELAAYLSAGITVHRPQQIHSARVLRASEAGAEPWPEADGLVSDGGGQSLWVCGADCTPVLLADPCSGRVAACHAGWRGVAGRILPAAIARLAASGSNPGDLLVALGPCVSGANYQVERPVSLEVAASLRSQGSQDQAALEELLACGALLADPDPHRDRLDLRSAIVRQLRNEGVAGHSIAVCPLCTAAAPDLFHSWRRDQVKAVQWSGIVSQS
ncbi:MAG: peptidoglycan editing factor PgeF [Cyanobium sp.]